MKASQDTSVNNKGPEAPEKSVAEAGLVDAEGKYGCSTVLYFDE